MSAKNAGGERKKRTPLNSIDRWTKRPMELTAEDGTSIENPTETDVETVLEEGAGNEDFFAILARNEMTYIQAAGHKEIGFVVEYQEETLEEHYQSAEKNIDIRRVIEMFQLYLAGNPAWIHKVSWEKELL
jgi:hypothetical protein